jgi:hypothetical protein
MKTRLGLWFAICSALYFAAFVVVHRSSSSRRPAYNMAYWYYSDSDAVELVEFYGFWPLRQLSYKFFPSFMSQHITERKWVQPVYPPGFDG